MYVCMYSYAVDTVFIRLNAAAFIKFLAFPINAAFIQGRRSFEGGVSFEVTLFKSTTTVLVNRL